MNVKVHSGPVDCNPANFAVYILNRTGNNGDPTDRPGQECFSFGDCNLNSK